METPQIENKKLYPLKMESPLRLFALNFTPHIHMEEWLKEQRLVTTLSFSLDSALINAHNHLKGLGIDSNNLDLTNQMSVPIEWIMKNLTISSEDVKLLWGYSTESSKTPKEKKVGNFIYDLMYVRDTYADEKEKNIINNLITKIQNVKPIS